MSETDVEATTDDAVVEVPPAMQKALDSGWAPQEKWSGDPDQWVDYKEFNFRGELMGRIQEQSSVLSSYKNKLDSAHKAIDDLKDFNKTISEREFKKALKQLKQEKYAAVEDGNTARVVELDEEIDELTEQAKNQDREEATTTPQENQVPQEILDWVNRSENSWYSTDTALHNYANSVMTEIRERNPYATPVMLLQQMEERVKQDMPTKFKSNSPVNAVDDGDGNMSKTTSRSAKKATFRDLTQEQQEVAKNFERNGVMSRDEYVQSLIEDGEL